MRKIVCLSLTLVVVGCSAPAARPADERLDVVATIYPLAYLAERIGGDAVHVTLLTPAGSEPHDFEPTPQDIARIQDADVFLMNGGVDRWADKADRSSRVTLKMQDVIPFYGSGGTVDPHAWLDPELLKMYANQVELVLAKQVHTEAEQNTLTANNALLQQEIDSVDAAYRQGLAQCTSRTVVVSHDAFGYLGRRYQLTILPIAGLSPEQEPSPAQLRTITDAARQAHTTTIFMETLASPKLAETLAQELDLQTGVLNPLEGLTTKEREQGQDLLSLMRQNLQNLRTALPCP